MLTATLQRYEDIQMSGYCNNMKIAQQNIINMYAHNEFKQWNCTNLS